MPFNDWNNGILPPPPPEPLYDPMHNRIGQFDRMTNQISLNNTMHPPMTLNVMGNCVYDQMNNMVGQLGPGNTMYPPPNMGPTNPYG